MKKCRFCAEEIQEEAIKCRFCGEFLDGSQSNNKPQEVTKWYCKTSTLVFGFFVVGPLILPLVWINKKISKQNKIVITILVVALSVVLWEVSARSLATIKDQYSYAFSLLE